MILFTENCEGVRVSFLGLAIDEPSGRMALFWVLSEEVGNIHIKTLTWTMYTPD